MKKKLVLVVAVVLIAITACALLVGCVPNRPDKFMATWVKSNNKAMSVGVGDATLETGIDGNKIIVKTNDENQTIFEEAKGKLNIYVCLAGKWTAETVELTDEKAEDYKKTKEEFTKTPESMKAIEEEFDKNFEKKDGKWVGKGIYSIVSFTIKGNELTMEVAEMKIPTKMILNYKISIPSEAKAALK
ncbi:MAG: hypothetical protein K2P12_03870 [Clostridia bacterium]|nr:hypothetical protein [Clostridia bacterium]